MLWETQSGLSQTEVKINAPRCFGLPICGWWSVYLSAPHTGTLSPSVPPSTPSHSTRLRLNLLLLSSALRSCCSCPFLIYPSSHTSFRREAAFVWWKGWRWPAKARLLTPHPSPPSTPLSPLPRQLFLLRPATDIGRPSQAKWWNISQGTRLTEQNERLTKLLTQLQRRAWIKHSPLFCVISSPSHFVLQSVCVWVGGGCSRKSCSRNTQVQSFSGLRHDEALSERWPSSPSGPWAACVHTPEWPPRLKPAFIGLCARQAQERSWSSLRWL